MWYVFRRDALEVLYNKRARDSLARYFAVMSDEKPANFMIAKRIPAEFREDYSPKDLWAEHDRLTEEFYKVQKEIDSGKRSLGDLRMQEKS
ncbi:MAG: hypothetical protein QXR13_01060, partial [Candidatus Bathyarchaeia archaeon]